METTIYIGCGLFFYFAAFLVIGGIGMLIFAKRFIKKYGPFFEYTLAQGLRLYYPEIYYNLVDKVWWYRILFVIAWPVMLTKFFVASAKSLNRLAKLYHW